MYGIASDILLAICNSLKQFWRALLRFGSPRFSVQSVKEFQEFQTANDDESNEEIDCRCQLQAA